MILRSPLFLLLSLLLLPLLLVSAATPTSFCKCTCFTNSTIIALDSPPQPSSLISPLTFPRNAAADDNDDAPPPSPPSSPNRKEGTEKQYRAGNCNDCNKQFCLDYNLPICRGAGLADVVSVCFQRDSRKDEAVVFVFIVVTAGLLLWGLVRPWVDRWVQSAQERRSYIPVSNESGH